MMCLVQMSSSFSRSELMAPSGSMGGRYFSNLTNIWPFQIFFSANTTLSGTPIKLILSCLKASHSSLRLFLFLGFFVSFWIISIAIIFKGTGLSFGCV